MSQGMERGPRESRASLGPNVAKIGFPGITVNEILGNVTENQQENSLGAGFSLTQLSR